MRIHNEEQGSISRLAKAALIAAASMAELATAQAATKLALAPSSGHPDIAVSVSGSGFGDSEAVDIYVDVTDTRLAVTTPTGTLAASLTIPVSAQPGVHTITAIGRKSGDTVQAAFTVSTSWAETGFGAAQQSWNPWENTLGPSVVPSLGLLWRTPVGATGGLSVAGGRVFVGSLSGVAALSTTTGALLWRSQVVSDATPAVSGATVYVGDQSGIFYGLSASKGTVVWENTLASGQGAIFTSALVQDGVAYVGNANYNIYAINAKSGSTIWSHNILGPPGYSPTVAGGIVFVPGQFNGDQGAIFRLDQSNGNDLGVLANFFYAIPFQNPISVVDGVGFFSNGDSAYGCNVRDDNIYGCWTSSDAVVFNGFTAVAEGTFFTSDGGLGVYNAATGTLNWSLSNSPDGLGFVGSISVADGILYAGTYGGNIFAYLALYGTLLWEGATGGTVQGQPVVSDGVLYISSSDGSVYAFAPNAGTDLRARHSQPPKPADLHPDVSLSPAN